MWDGATRGRPFVVLEVGEGDWSCLWLRSADGEGSRGVVIAEVYLRIAPLFVVGDGKALEVEERGECHVANQLMWMIEKGYEEVLSLKRTELFTNAEPSSDCKIPWRRRE